MKKSSLILLGILIILIIAIIGSVIAYDNRTQISKGQEIQSSDSPLQNYLAEVSNASTTPQPSQHDSSASNSTSSGAPIQQGTSSGSGTVTSSQSPYYVFVQPDNYSKNPGSSVIFYGRHFIAGEHIKITQHGTAIGSAVATTLGTFTSGPYPVPFVNGTITYGFTGSVSNIPFNVELSVKKSNPWIVLNNYYARTGTPIVITGHSFGSNEIVVVTFGSTSLSIRTGAQGDFTITIPVPAGTQGKKSITAVGQSSGAVATQSFSQA